MSGCDDLVTLEQLELAKIDLNLLAEAANGENKQIATRLGQSIPTLKRVMDTILAEGLGGVTQNREVVNTFAALQALTRDPETREVLMLGFGQAGDGGGQRWYLDTVDATPGDAYPFRVQSANGDVWRPVRLGTERSVSPSKFGGDFAATMAFAQSTGRRIHLDDLASLTFPLQVTQDVEIDLGRQTVDLNQLLANGVNLANMIEVSDNVRLRIFNGRLEANDRITNSMILLGEGSTLVVEGVEFYNTGAADDPTNNTVGIQAVDKDNVSVLISDFKFFDVPLPIRLRGAFSIIMERGEFESYSRAVHEFLSSVTSEPIAIFGRNLLAHSVKPNPTKFGYQINRQNGRRISCHPVYINCDIVGNVDGNGDPITWVGGANPNNGHADMWPWQGVDGGTRIGCKCSNGGDSGESMTRTTANITNISCEARNMEGQGVNSGSALVEITGNSGTIANFTNGEEVILGAIGVGEIASIDTGTNTVTFTNLIPSNILSESTAAELEVIRGYVNEAVNNESDQASIQSVTNSSIVVDNIGAFQVGNFVGFGIDTSVGRFERTFTYDNRIALIGSLVYQTPKSNQQMRSKTTVITLTSATTGQGNTWIGGRYENNGRNLDGSLGSFSNFFINQHDNATLTNVSIGSGPNAVVISRSQNVRIDADVSESDNGISAVGSSTFVSLRDTLKNDRTGQHSQVEAFLRLTRLGSAGAPEAADMDAGAIYFDTVEGIPLMRDSAVEKVTLLGDSKQGAYYPYSKGIQLPFTTTANRPNTAGLPNGFVMWDSTLATMIILVGNTWRNASGGAV